MKPLDLVLVLLSVPALLVCGYLLLLAMASRRPAARPIHDTPSLRFDLIVPAHDEEWGIARTVKSLLSADYPEALRRVLVVADNCTDRTAELAAAAGATVLVREDPQRRGKGYALAHAFERSLADGFADAVVVVDADTVVSPELLGVFAARLSGGARTVQAADGVLNTDASWRTRLMALGMTLVNELRSLARERLGLSCGLRGNGMCFASSLLREHPHRAFSVVEDLEYGIELGQAGVRVHYAPDAVVRSTMVSSEPAARSQRLRWESGRRAMARRHALPLLTRGLRSCDPVLLDLAMDLLVPPLASITLAVVLGSGASLVASWAAGHLLAACWVWLACALMLVGYVLRGWWLSGIGPRGLAALGWAPAYVLWKLTLPWRRSRSAPGEWVRTAREGEGGSV